MGLLPWNSWHSPTMLRSFKSFNDNCKDGESACTKKFWLIPGSSLGGALFLVIAFAIIRHFLVRK